MLRKVLLTALAFVAFGLTKFLFGILVIRWEPTLLGEINHSLSIFLLIPLFYAPGLGMVVSKFASEFRGARESRKSQEVFTFCFILVTVIAAICTIVVFVFFARLRGKVEVSPTTQYGLTPMLLLYSLYVFLRTSYYGFDRVSLYLRNEIISSAVFFVVLAGALLTRSRWLVVLPFACHSTLFVTIALADLREEFQFHNLARGIAADFRRYAHFFLCTIVNSLAGPGAFHFSIILTGWLTGDREIVGYYSVLLYSLQPLNLLPTAVNTVLMPTVSLSHGAGEKRQALESTSKAFRTVFLGMTLIWGGAAILGWEAVFIATSTQTAVHLAAFQLLLFGAYFYLVSSPPSVLLNGTEHIRIIAWGGAVALATAVAFWLGAVPRYGLIGAAAGYALLEIVKGVWAFAGAWRVFRWRGHFGSGAAVTVLAAVGLAALALTRTARPIHITAAAVFTLFFLLVFLNEIRDYLSRLVAELRSYATKT